MERPFKPRNTKRAKELRRQASPAERRLWQYLANSQLDGHKFSRQIPIGPYFADFVCRAAKLVVELDGFSHDVRVDYDKVRTKFIEAQGYSVIRFNNEDVVRNLEGVLIMIAQALTSPLLPAPNSLRVQEGNTDL
jgi:very-short-patch-repair endonuclease